MNLIFQPFKKYADFNGRARRSEFWPFMLFIIIASLLVQSIDAVTQANGMVTLVFSIVVLLPQLAVTVRRLHDTNRSGWWCFLYLVPLVGFIIVSIFASQNSEPGDNRFGPNPKDEDIEVPQAG
ncbi:DUF805 domain-containing protein [Kiloniella sp. b19]|uniref:DUF805 domain-containing protein n=1 Tax=Kiloniella sp. GXU_MW_B19 TaxID=3141326 RepID=UPI0031D698FB